MKVSKVAIFTPYIKKLNDEVLEYFKNEKAGTTNLYFDISIDGIR